MGNLLALVIGFLFGVVVGKLAFSKTTFATLKEQPEEKAPNQGDIDGNDPKDQPREV